MLSSHAVDGHQMYVGGSVAGKVSTIGREISPTPLLIFTEVKKCEIWCRLKHHLTLSRTRLKMQQDIQIRWSPRRHGQVWWSWVHVPLRKLCQFWPTPYNCTRRRAKMSITQPWIIRFRSNFVRCLNARHPKCCKSSRSEIKGEINETDILFLKKTYDIVSK